MRSSVLWRKQSRIIMMLAESLHIDAERALNLFYTTKVYQHLSDPKYGLQLLSDRADLAVVDRHSLTLPIQLADRRDDRRSAGAECLVQLAVFGRVKELLNGDLAL